VLHIHNNNNNNNNNNSFYVQLGVRETAPSANMSRYLPTASWQHRRTEHNNNNNNSVG
jgi:hypothetical protein